MIRRILQSITPERIIVSGLLYFAYQWMNYGT